MYKYTKIDLLGLFILTVSFFVLFFGTVYAGFSSPTFPDVIVCSDNSATTTLYISEAPPVTLTTVVDYYNGAGDMVRYLKATGGYLSSAGTVPTMTGCTSGNVSSVVSVGKSFDFVLSSGGGGSVSTSTILSILQSNTGLSSTTAAVSNPNQDYFNGLLLFFGMVFFVVWFFRGASRR